MFKVDGAKHSKCARLRRWKMTSISLARGHAGFRQKNKPNSVDLRVFPARSHAAAGALSKFRDIRYHPHQTSPRQPRLQPRGIVRDRCNAGRPLQPLQPPQRYVGYMSDTYTHHSNRLRIEEPLSNLTCRTVVCACRWAYERMPKELWSTHFSFYF